VFVEVVADCRPWSCSSPIRHSFTSPTGGGDGVAPARVGLSNSLRTDGRAARRAVRGGLDWLSQMNPSQTPCERRGRRRGSRRACGER
jgi:hypothetical protein